MWSGGIRYVLTLCNPGVTTCMTARSWCWNGLFSTSGALEVKNAKLLTQQISCRSLREEIINIADKNYLPKMLVPGLLTAS